MIDLQCTPIYAHGCFLDMYSQILTISRTSTDRPIEWQCQETAGIFGQLILMFQNVKYYKRYCELFKFKEIVADFGCCFAVLSSRLFRWLSFSVSMPAGPLAYSAVKWLSGSSLKVINTMQRHCVDFSWWFVVFRTRTWIAHLTACHPGQSQLHVCKYRIKFVHKRMSGFADRRRLVWHFANVGMTLRTYDIRSILYPIYISYRLMHS